MLSLRLVQPTSWKLTVKLEAARQAQSRWSSWKLAVELHARHSSLRLVLSSWRLVQPLILRQFWSLPAGWRLPIELNTDCQAQSRWLSWYLVVQLYAGHAIWRLVLSSWRLAQSWILNQPKRLPRELKTDHLAGGWLSSSRPVVVPKASCWAAMGILANGWCSWHNLGYWNNPSYEKRSFLFRLWLKVNYWHSILEIAKYET